MGEGVPAAVRTGPGRTELRELPMPESPDDGALLEVEIAGICEHYLPCHRCAWCRAGEDRHCEATDWRTNPDALRYGYTSAGRRVLDLTGGEGVDVVLDCTAGAGTAAVVVGIAALKRRRGTLLVQGGLRTFPDFPLKTVTEKAITIKSARGHSYRACELSLRQLASQRFPLDRLTTHTFGLNPVDRAIRAVGGDEDADVVHVSLLPWKKDIT